MKYLPGFRMTADNERVIHSSFVNFISIMHSLVFLTRPKTHGFLMDDYSVTLNFNKDSLVFSNHTCVLDRTDVHFKTNLS